MFKISNLFTLLIVTAFSIKAAAQQFSNTPVVDALGRPVPVNRYGKVKGSPYIIDEWLPSKVVMGDKVYKKMLLKYNVETDMPLFVYNKTDEPLKFAEPVQSFTLYADKEITFASNFPKVDGYRANSFYEVLADGNTKLLKHYREIVKDVRDDNMNPIDGQYVNMATYYIFKQGKMLRVKLNKESILGALSDRVSQLNTYLSAQQINFQNETDLKKLIDYYNTL